jgi:hypothetical protein
MAPRQFEQICFSALFIPIPKTWGTKKRRGGRGIWHFLGLKKREGRLRFWRIGGFSTSIPCFPLIAPGEHPKKGKRLKEKFI